MRSSMRVTMRVAAGFAADADPVAAPATVPVDRVFRVPDQLPQDGSPSAIQMWLDNATAAETASVEIWGLDADSNPQEAMIAEPFKPVAAHRWSRLVAATVVTAPQVQAVTGRVFSGFLYVRQTASTLTTAHLLKLNPIRL